MSEGPLALPLRWVAHCWYSGLGGSLLWGLSCARLTVSLAATRQVPIVPSQSQPLKKSPNIAKYPKPGKPRLVEKHCPTPRVRYRPRPGSETAGREGRGTRREPRLAWPAWNPSHRLNPCILTKCLPTATVAGVFLFIRNRSGLSPSSCWFFQFGRTEPTGFSDQSAISQLWSCLSCEAGGPAWLPLPLGHPSALGLTPNVTGSPGVAHSHTPCLRESGAS